MLCRYIPFALIIQIALACTPGDRSFSIVNNCKYTVWVAEISQNGGDGWEMESGQTTDLCLSSTWSGRFWPRTSCSFGTDGLCDPPTSQCCSTGNCINDENQFALKCTHSGVPPVTIAEFTLGNFGQSDYYDVSMVDGASIPVEIHPKDGTYVAEKGGDLYHCGSPGCTQQTCDDTSLGTCSWNYEAGIYATQMTMVEPTQCNSNSQCTSGQCNLATHTCSCTTDTECSTGEVCGKRQIAGVGVVSACGQSIGMFSANTICSLDSSLGYPLLCTEIINGQGDHMNLYGCTGINSGSCYSNDAGANCCGCPSWSPSGKCQNENQEWILSAEPTVAIFKNACPTAYSFPYDDITSTFTCQGTSATNMPGYTITFCPAGSPGSAGVVTNVGSSTTSAIKFNTLATDMSSTTDVQSTTKPFWTSTTGIGIGVAVVVGIVVVVTIVAVLLKKRLRPAAATRWY